ncbi:MAG: zf-HC2 domain-containing protein [Thermoanaerobaculia bacterium]
MMQQPEHTTYLEWLHSEHDGELSPRERSMLRRHLASCAECQAEERELAALEELLAASRMPVREGFREEVLASLPAAGWEARHPRRWTAALVVSALLGAGAAALMGASAARLEPAAPFLAAVTAVFDLFRSSVLAGAGLLGASWQGLGLAFEHLLSGSIWNAVAFGVLVVGVDYLLIRLLLWRRRPAEASALERPRKSSRTSLQK